MIHLHSVWSHTLDRHPAIAHVRVVVVPRPTLKPPKEEIQKTPKNEGGNAKGDNVSGDIFVV